MLTYNGCVKFYLQVKIVQYIVSTCSGRVLNYSKYVPAPNYLDPTQSFQLVVAFPYQLLVIPF